MNSAEFLQAASLSKLPRIRHAFFTRQGGASDGVYESLNGGIGSGDAPEKVRENRARMASALGVAAGHLITAYQIHSPDVVVVEKPWAHEMRPRADAMVACTPGLALGITTADCGPVLFADSAAGVIGAAHAGWRGAFTGVIEATLETMERLGAERARISVALGPMIRQDNYEVGPEFVIRFVAGESDNWRFFRPSAREGHAMFDLPGYIRHRLTGAGVTHIEDLGLCTCADAERFYSYRRMTLRGEKDYGRHVSAIVLTN